MSRRTRVATVQGLAPFFAEPGVLPQPFPPSESPWEVEIGFGKGRYLLRRATSEPAGRFLGIEIASEYFRLVARRVARRRLVNVVLLEGDAQYLAGTILPRGFARAVHVYFPDPWPKTRHQRRRLFAPESLDLVLGLLAPGGRLYFATDFLAYGEEVRQLLESHPGASVTVHAAPWPDGARTNYEAKYIVEGRPILRLEVAFEGAAAPHPRGLLDLLVASSLDYEPET
ncbi:MAG: tRNA (guanine-N7-)-methyltransferase [Acidobacteriota bacterium]|nr:tRNA (guanine-N7-)-methyltransferase [Acidobacteriota bacterium]